MGFFSPKSGGSYYASVSPMGSGPQPMRKLPKEEPKDKDDEDTEVEQKKVYEKEKIVKGPVEDETENSEDKKDQEKKPETETQLNTRLNSLLYHTSDDTVDLYRLENNSLDLLGRIYYDDFDPTDSRAIESLSSLSGSATPVPKTVVNQKIRPSFERGVSFDTLSDTHHLSIILKEKHPEFKFRRNNKTFLVGFSNDSQSLRAVEWAFQEMVIHGDTIVVFHVLDDRSYKAVEPSSAESILLRLKKLNSHEKKVSLVYEVVIGRPQKLLKEAILEYNPAMMIVGTHQEPTGSLSASNSSTNIAGSSHHRHHSSFFGKSSISKYFLQYALVPVIVVKPFYQYHEELQKPIDSEKYFLDWIGGVDLSQTYEKKKKKSRFLLSPQSSRNSSATNLMLSATTSIEARGRTVDENLLNDGSRDSSVSSQERSRTDTRSHSRSRLSKLFSI